MSINNPFNAVIDAVRAMREEFMTLNDSGLNFDKESEWVLQACEKNDYAIKVSLANINAVCAAVRNLAGIGLTLDPAMKFAYVLPRDNAMIYEPGYLGLIELAVRSGSIKWAQARRVYSLDTYEPQGFDKPPVHKYKAFGKAGERGDLLGVYVVAKTIDNDYLTDEMSLEEIDSIRLRSPAEKKGSHSPWKSDPGEMQKKTVIKRAYKYWPRTDATGRLEKAIHYLNTEGGQGMDLTPEDESRTAVEIWTGKVNAAGDAASVAAVWKEARAAITAVDPSDTAGLEAARKTLEEVRAAVAARNRALGVTPPPPAAPAQPEQQKHEPGSSSAPAQAPTQPPASRAATPPPPPAQESPEAVILRDIKAAQTYDDLNAIGPRIDAADPECQSELNDEFDLRLGELKKKYGHE